MGCYCSACNKPPCGYCEGTEECFDCGRIFTEDMYEVNDETEEDIVVVCKQCKEDRGIE